MLNVINLIFYFKKKKDCTTFCLPILAFSSHMLYEKCSIVQHLVKMYKKLFCFNTYSCIMLCYRDPGGVQYTKESFLFTARDQSTAL